MDTENTIKQAEIAVIGGTGLYSFLDDIEEVQVETPYSSPSDVIAVGTLKGKKVAFLPRHGKHHQYPPHKINFRANMWALKAMGVRFVFAPCAAGSLQAHIRPGDFLIADQFVDRTSGRHDTFYDTAPVTHMPGVNPFCNELRSLAQSVFREKNMSFHEKGTVVVIQGPRFSTKAESEWFTKMGWDLVNMTLYPEAILARELELSYVNLSLVTDYDSGLRGQFEPVTAQEAVRVFRENTQSLKEALFLMIERLDLSIKTPSHSALATARF